MAKVTPRDTNTTAAVKSGQSLCATPTFGVENNAWIAVTSGRDRRLGTDLLDGAWTVVARDGDRSADVAPTAREDDRSAGVALTAREDDRSAGVAPTAREDDRSADVTLTAR